MAESMSTHNHEELDTMIPLHVIDAIGDSTLRDMDVWSERHGCVVWETWMCGLRDMDVWSERHGCVVWETWMCGLTYWSRWWTLWLMDDLVHSPSSISSLEKATSIDRSTFVSVWVSLAERSVKVWLVSIRSQVQIGEWNVLASQRRVGSLRIPIFAQWWPYRLCLPTTWRRGARGRWAARRGAAHREVCLISIHLSLALGTIQVQESGEREASSHQSNTDAPYLTHQYCGYEGQKLYNTSTMPTAPRGK